MGRIRRGRSERPLLGRLTEEYLEEVRRHLTTRDYEILKLLAHYPVMNSEHLRILCPGTEKLPPFYTLAKGQQRLNDRLRVLFDYHLIHKESPILGPGEGSSKQYCWLDRGGIRLLGLNQDHRNTLPAHYLHSSLILDLISQFHLLARNKTIQLLYLQFEEHQQTWRLIPDLTVLYRQGDRGFLYFIEVDRSEKKERDELEKIRSYRQWQTSALWVKEAWAAHLPKKVFPVLLYVFEERKSYKRRQTLFLNTAKEEGLSMKAYTLSEFKSSLTTRPV